MAVPEFDIIARIIVRKLNDASSEEEDAVLEKWLEESEANRNAYARICSGKELKRYIDMEAELSRIYKTEDFLLHKRHPHISFKKIAAVLLLLISAGGLIILKTRKSCKTPIPLSLHQEKPVLILPQGQKLDLHNDSVLIAASGGIYKGDTLSYIRLPENRMEPKRKNEWHTLFIPHGMPHIIELSDGSKIWLNAASSLQYPRKFPNDKREGHLKGEAYFEIAEDHTRPFIVLTDSQNSEVTGTKFNIRAYNTKQTITTLVEGGIRVSTSVASIELNPGEQSCTQENGEILRKKVNADSYTSWRTGIYSFDKIPLYEIIETLTRRYNISFFWQKENLKTLVLSGELDMREDITNVLKQIEILKKIHFVPQKQGILIRIKN